MYLKFVLIPPESKKVISENLSQVGQIVQKQEKGFAAVHNKLEPPNTGNILVSRQMKAEEWYNGVKLWYFVYQYCPAFSLVYHKSIRIYQVSELTFEMGTLGLLHRTDPLAAHPSPFATAVSQILGELRCLSQTTLDAGNPRILEQMKTVRA